MSPRRWEGDEPVGLFDAGARRGRGPQRASDRVATVPNAITALRLLGLPVFAWLVLGPGAYGSAFVLLVVIGATDWVDGYVARRFNQVSRVGVLLDPLVDRALLATALVTLLIEDIVPWVLVAVVVGRDIVVLGGAFALFGGIPRELKVNNAGKAATAALLVGIPLFLAGEWLEAAAVTTAAEVITVAGVAAYYASGAQYAQAALELRRRSG